MDTLLTDRQIFFRQEIESFLETQDRGRMSEVRMSELRNAFWGSGRTLLDRVPALEELSRRDPGLARKLAGRHLDGLDHGPVYRTAVLLGKTAGVLNERLKEFEAAGASEGFRSPSGRGSAQETVDLITAFETARFLTFRAAVLADLAAAGAESVAAGCEALAREIAERAIGAGWNGRLREGERP